jgi:hypothetical protein
MSLLLLKDILERNYEALGFRLCEIIAQDHLSHVYVYGMIQCPCGGYESFCWRVTNLKHPEQLACKILSITANKTHLQQDIDAGTLPPFDIDKHCFTGVLCR